MRRDYLEQEARNTSLGLAGERFIVGYERWRLASLGKEKLAEKVEHVSVTQGDGLGFDILSFEASGRDRLIEVKTTSFGRETPSSSRARRWISPVPSPIPFTYSDSSNSDGTPAYSASVDGSIRTATWTP